MIIVLRRMVLIALCALIPNFLSSIVRAEIDTSTCIEMPLLDAGLPVELRVKPDGGLQTRVALVIGNSAYQNISTLRNPGNDAEAVAHSLQLLGFQTVLLLDATVQEILSCKDQLLSRYPEADIGFLYYAGHGIQIKDSNYLLGVDASQQEGSDGLVDVTELVEALQRHWKATLVFLDACRDNPYGDDRPQGLSPSTARGAIRVAYTGELVSNPRAQPLGTFIAYSTSPNATATDGIGAMSPFAAVFAETVLSPGISIQEVMAEVNRGVGEETGWTQRPWTRSSLEVALKLAGTLTASQVRAISDGHAAKARTLLMTGARTEAIFEALKGVPFLPKDGSNYDYQEAWNSLTNAYRSTALRLDADGASTVVLSSDLSRALLVKFSGEHAARLELWDTASGARINVVFEYDGDDMFRLKLVDPVFSADSSRFASIMGKGRVGVWSAYDGSLVRIIDSAIRNRFEDDDSPHFQRIDLNSDGTMLLASGGGVDYANLWNVDEDRIILTLSPSTFGDLFVDPAPIDSINKTISHFIPGDCSPLSSHSQFIDDNNVLLLCLYGVNNYYSAVVSVIQLKNYAVSIAFAMEPGFSFADSRKNLDISLNNDSTLAFTFGSTSKTSAGEWHIYKTYGGLLVRKHDNPTHAIGMFSPYEDVVAIISDNSVSFIDGNNGDYIPNRYGVISNDFLHTPTIFSPHGDIIGVDYSQLGRAIWQDIPESSELERLALGLLSDEQRALITTERLRFWSR